MMTACCPCIAIYQAAEDIGDDNGIILSIGTLLGFGSCMYCLMADKVAKKRGIDQGMPMHCCCICFDPCTCFSCAVINEARLYKVAQESPEAKAIER